MDRAQALHIFDGDIQVCDFKRFKQAQDLHIFASARLDLAGFRQASWGRKLLSQFSFHQRVGLFQSICHLLQQWPIVGWSPLTLRVISLLALVLSVKSLLV